MKASGSSILLSSHILSTIENYCDRFIVLHRGQVIAQGTLNELRSQFGESDATLGDMSISSGTRYGLSMISSCYGSKDAQDSGTEFFLIWVMYPERCSYGLFISRHCFLRLVYIVCPEHSGGISDCWVALLLLAPLVLFSSYRTYLLPADIVFLPPQEYRMQEYLKNSFARGIIYKTLGLLLVFVTLWPLYVRADLDARPFGWFIVFLLLWKGLSSYGAWQELRMVQVGAARGYRLLRWALAVLAVGAWLWQPPQRGSGSCCCWLLSTSSPCVYR